MFHDENNTKIDWWCIGGVVRIETTLSFLIFTKKWCKTVV